MHAFFSDICLRDAANKIKKENDIRKSIMMGIVDILHRISESDPCRIAEDWGVLQVCETKSSMQFFTCFLIYRREKDKKSLNAVLLCSQSSCSAISLLNLACSLS